MLWLADTVRSARHHMVLHCAHDGETATANECLTALVGAVLPRACLT